MYTFREVLARSAWMIAAGLLAAGCDREPDDWARAQGEGSMTGYQRYLDEHPDGAHAEAATQSLEQLRVEAAWSEATVTNSLDAYASFLERHPQSDYTAVAQARRKALRLDPTMNVSMSLQTPPGMFMQSDPGGKVQAYPPGTRIGITLRATADGEPVEATLTGTYEEMNGELAHFRTDDGECLAVHPLGYGMLPRITPCGGGDPPLPDGDTPAEILIFAWRWLEAS